MGEGGPQLILILVHCLNAPARQVFRLPPYVNELEGALVKDPQMHQDTLPGCLTLISCLTRRSVTLGVKPPWVNHYCHDKVNVIPYYTVGLDKFLKEC
jgi:hypothetical protein